MPGKRPYELEDAEDPSEILPEGFAPGDLDREDPALQDFTVVVCFEDETRDRFLMARHKDRGWELPGGRVELHENPLLAALREFGEETGNRLLDPEIVLKTPTEKGRCFVVAGRWGPPAEGHDPSVEDKIVETTFVERLDEVEPLAWPDDPYDEIEHALGVTLR